MVFILGCVARMTYHRLLERVFGCPIVMDVDGLDTGKQAAEFCGLYSAFNATYSWAGRLTTICDGALELPVEDQMVYRAEALDFAHDVFDLFIRIAVDVQLLQVVTGVEELGHLGRDRLVNIELQAP
jgi:hypothetical protein